MIPHFSHQQEPTDALGDLRGDERLQRMHELMASYQVDQISLCERCNGEGKIAYKVHAQCHWGGDLVGGNGQPRPTHYPIFDRGQWVDRFTIAYTECRTCLGAGSIARFVSHEPEDPIGACFGNDGTLPRLGFR